MLIANFRYLLQMNIQYITNCLTDSKMKFLTVLDRAARPPTSFMIIIKFEIKSLSSTKGQLKGVVRKKTFHRKM